MGADIWRTYRIPIILGSLSLLFIALSITIFIKSYQSSEPITFSSDARKGAVIVGATGSAEVSTIVVDIEGAVVKPGVYHVPQGSRVEDAITAAGGFSNSVDTDAVAKVLNRAAKLSDGSKLYIPEKGSVDSYTSTPISPGTSSTFSSLININSASQSQLDALSGVGPVTAGKIIAGRPYMRLEELVEKKAMSQSLFTKLKEQLTL